MELFSTIIEEVRAFVASRAAVCSVITAARPWPIGGPRNIVLADDIAVELGSPQMESLSCILWTDQHTKLNDGALTIIGPDIAAARGSLPFGKIVLVGVDGFDAENTYDRARELEGARYNLDLQGYMIRAVSQYQREWCRISREAARQGFCFEVLAGALMTELRKLPYVREVEMICVTSSPEDVRELQRIIKDVGRIIGAMNKMASELDADCTDCEFQDVCDEAEELKGMRERMRKKRESVHA